MTATSVALIIKERARARRDLPPPQMRRALRLSTGLSTADVAAAVGVSRQAISNWETGRRTPRGENLHAYLDALGALREAGNAPST